MLGFILFLFEIQRDKRDWLLQRKIEKCYTKNIVIGIKFTRKRF